MLCVISLQLLKHKSRKSQIFHTDIQMYNKHLTIFYEFGSYILKI